MQRRKFILGSGALCAAGLSGCSYAPLIELYNRSGRTLRVEYNTSRGELRQERFGRIGKLEIYGELIPGFKIIGDECTHVFTLAYPPAATFRQPWMYPELKLTRDRVIVATDKEMRRKFEGKALYDDRIKSWAIRPESERCSTDA